MPAEGLVRADDQHRHGQDRYAQSDFAIHHSFSIQEQKCQNRLQLFRAIRIAPAAACVSEQKGVPSARSAFVGALNSSQIIDANYADRVPSGPASVRWDRQNCP
jgi:hypothetical protein